MSKPPPPKNLTTDIFYKFYTIFGKYTVQSALITHDLPSHDMDSSAPLTYLVCIYRQLLLSLSFRRAVCFFNINSNKKI